METTKNVKFNFDDAGSLKRVKQLYDDFLNNTVNKSINFGQNSPGTFGAQSTRYITQEISELKKLTDARQKDFQNKLSEFEHLRRQEASIKRRRDSGDLTDSRANERLADVEYDRKALLSGTGYRKEKTFIAGESENISREADFLEKMEKTLENSNSILRNILSATKEEALKMIQAIDENDGATPDEKLAASRAHAALAKDEKESKDSDKRGIVHDLLTASNLTGLLSSARSIGTSTSVMDATRNTVQAGFQGVNAIGDAFGPIGGAISRVITTVADIAFQQKMLVFEMRSNLDRSRFRSRAISGGIVEPTDLAEYGFSLQDVSDSTEGIIKGAGTSRNGQKNVRDALLLERGQGIDVGISAQLLELTRANQENDKDLTKLIGGISGSPIFDEDRTFLAEFIGQNFTGLQREFQKNQTSVNSGTVLDVLNTFHAIGGQFDARNPNSSGLITNINDALSNPQGDSMRALSFMALKQSMPEASITDILREQEKGISSPKYLKSIIDLIDSMGAGEDQQILQLTSLGIGVNAATDLYKNRHLIGEMSTEELNGRLNLESSARENTTKFDRDNADFANRMIQGEALDAIIKGVQAGLASAFDGATYTIMPDGSLHVTNTKPIIENTTKTPFKTQHLGMGQYSK